MCNFGTHFFSLAHVSGTGSRIWYLLAHVSGTWLTYLVPLAHVSGTFGTRILNLTLTYYFPTKYRKHAQAQREKRSNEDLEKTRKKHRDKPGYHLEMIKCALSHGLYSNDQRIQNNLIELTDIQRKTLLRAVTRKQSSKFDNTKLTEEEKEDFK